MKRVDSRKQFDLRDIKITRNYLPYAEGSCLFEMGGTKIIIAASVEESVPPWLIGRGKGWVTAEYGMLPRATQNRNRRPVNSTKQNGRAMEIQRLIGRSLRAVCDMKVLGERAVTVDCDVISADGGTRVASIIGSAIALHDAGTWLIKQGSIKKHFMRELIAAISIGIKNGKVLADLCYVEDSSADVDMNVVMTESGKLVEVQGTAEGEAFDRKMMNEMLDAAEEAIQSIVEIQKSVIDTL